MGIAAGVMGAAIVAVAVKSVMAYAKMGDEVQKMALRTGFSTEALSELRFIAERSGTSLGVLEAGLRRMSSSLVDANNGLLESQRAFDELGLSTEELLKLSPEEQFRRITVALSKVESATIASATAQDIFGRSGTQLLAVVASGEQGMKDMAAEARKLGIVFDQEAANKAAEFQDRMTDLKAATQGLQFAFAQELVPVLIDVAEALIPIIANAKGVIGAYKDMLDWSERLGRTFRGERAPIQLTALTLEILAEIEEEVAKETRAAAAAALQLEDALKRETNAAEKAAEATKKFADSARDTITSILFLETEAGQLGLTIEDVGLAFLKSGGNVRDLDEALIATASSTEPVNALLSELNLVSLDVAIAVGKVESAASKAARVLKDEMAKAVEEAERAFADAKREMESFNQSIASMVEKATFATTEAGKLGISADKVRLAFLLAGGTTEKLSEILKDSAGRWNDVEFMMAQTGLTAKTITKLLGLLRDESDKLRKSLEETAKVGGFGAWARGQIAMAPTTGDPAVDRARVMAANRGWTADQFQEAIQLLRAGLPVPFHQGGIVTRPTLALIGEKGPEAVIPLKGGRGLGGGITINFNAPVYGIDDFRREVEQTIRDAITGGGFYGTALAG